MITIEKDVTNKTYQYNVTDTFGNSILFGDGYESSTEIIEMLAHMCNVLDESFKTETKDSVLRGIIIIDKND